MIPTQKQIEQLIADLNTATQREMIRIKLSLSDSLALTDSKFGGMPYIPKGEAHYLQVLKANHSLCWHKLTVNNYPKTISILKKVYCSFG